VRVGERFCFLPLLTILFNALSVVGDIVRDSLLQNNDVDSFAQKYLRWKVNNVKMTYHQYFMLVTHLILTYFDVLQ